MASQSTQTSSKQLLSTDERLRKLYSGLFEELQFRASRNALMNYHEAEVLDEKGRNTKLYTHMFMTLSSGGILFGILQKGKQLLANKAGLAGAASLPVCAAAEVLSNNTSQFMPSYCERAKKHVQAAAAWNRISERARTARLRILADPKFPIDKFSSLHDDLLREKEEVSKTVVIPRAVHCLFNNDHEKVFASIKRRNELYKLFKAYKCKEKLGKKSDDDDDDDDDLFYS